VRSLVAEWVGQEARLPGDFLLPFDLCREISKPVKILFQQRTRTRFETTLGAKSGMVGGDSKVLISRTDHSVSPLPLQSSPIYWQDSAIAGSSMFELCSSLCLNTSRFRTEKNLRNWNGALSHGVSVIVECLCTRRRSTH
jgi:hypothetical protein